MNKVNIGKLIQLLIQSSQGNPTIDEFLERLSLVGVSVIRIIDGDSLKTKAVRYTYNSESIDGVELGNVYTWEGIFSKLGVMEVCGDNTLPIEEVQAYLLWAGWKAKGLEKI